VTGPKRLAGVCTSAGDFLSRAGFSPLLYTAGDNVLLLNGVYFLGDDHKPVP
jgi:hypothetical protein